MGSDGQISLALSLRKVAKGMSFRLLKACPINRGEIKSKSTVIVEAFQPPSFFAKSAEKIMPIQAIILQNK
jgi:hypothetical protein